MNKSTWKYKTMESVCSKGCSNISINKLSDCKGTYPLYGASGYVKDIDFFHQDKPYIGIVKDGAGVGRVSIYPAKSSLVGTMQYIIPSSQCSINYLYHFLCSLNVSKFVSGATIPHIYFKDYGKSMIPIPSIKEQEIIASELDMITEMISKYGEQLKELDKLSQSIFYEMFGDPVENEKGWEVKKLGDISSICTGSTPNRNNDDYYKGTIPWVKSTEVNNCFINLTEENITEKAINETNCKIFPIGTILMAMYGQGKTRGQVAILNVNATTNQAIAAILPNCKYETLFIYHHLILMYEDIRSLARGGNQANLNLGLVNSIKVILPPLPLQQSFARKIEAIEAMKSKVREAKKEAETLLAARMQYWFE